MTLTDCDFISVMRRLANTDSTDYTDKVLRLKDSCDSGDSWSKKHIGSVVGLTTDTTLYSVMRRFNEHGL